MSNKTNSHFLQDLVQNDASYEFMVELITVPGIIVLIRKES